jgi:cytochrome P450
MGEFSRLNAAERPVADFDMYGEEFAADWRNIFDDMRSRSPIVWSPHYGGFWAFLRYDDIVFAERNPQIFTCDNDTENKRSGGKGIRIPPMPVKLDMMESDPPVHTPLRRLEAPFFSIQALQPQIEQAQRIADAQLDAAMGKGEIELVHDYGIATAAQIGLGLLGFDPATWADFADVALNAYFPPDHPAYPIEARTRALERLDNLIEEKRRNPGHDIVSTLVHSDLPLPTAHGMLTAMVFGAFDTVTATTCNAVDWLESHPEVHESLRTDEKAMDRAVDEFLRVFPPLVAGLARTVTQDYEMHGQLLRKGERVLLCFGAGSTDPEKFEDPHTVRLDRHNARQHLGYGAGPHRCLGAVIGQAELRILLTTLLNRAPNFRIDRDRAERFPRLGQVNGWKVMPVKLGDNAR